jgi:TIR domain
MAERALHKNRIFLSYRRDDAHTIASRLYDILSSHFGVAQVFMDIDSIEPGTDFLQVIQETIGSSDLFLVLIGKDWLKPRYEDRIDRRRRLDDPDDYVRIELEAARNTGVRILPVLVDEATMPTPEELPNSLQWLSRTNALQVRRSSFQHDVNQLISFIDRYFQTLPYPVSQVDIPPKQVLDKITTAPHNRIFVSYNHSDENWLRRLQVHLKPLGREGRIDLWDDTQIKVGDEWRIEIANALSSCQAAVLLISADFMASEFIYNNELPPLLEAARRRGVRILSVIVSSSSYEDTELARYQAVNSPSKPLDMMTRGEAEQVFVKLYDVIRDTLRS